MKPPWTARRKLDPADKRTFDVPAYRSHHHSREEEARKAIAEAKKIADERRAIDADVGGRETDEDVSMVETKDG